MIGKSFAQAAERERIVDRPRTERQLTDRGSLLTTLATRTPGKPQIRLKQVMIVIALLALPMALVWQRARWIEQIAYPAFSTLLLVAMWLAARRTRPEGRGFAMLAFVGIFIIAPVMISLIQSFSQPS
jgi:hypothetical protein